MKSQLILGIMLLFVLCISGNAYASSVTILDQNFDNNSLSGWDINSGTWITNFDLNGASLDTGSISHSVNMPVSGIYNIRYTALTSDPNLYGEFFFFTDQNGLADVNGYAVLLYKNNVFFTKRVSGTPTFLLTSTGISMDNNHTVEINIVQNTFTVLIDGVSIGQVTDSTFNHGSKVFFVTENSTGTYRFDDILITRETELVDITFLRPKNEKTLASIDGNWSVQLLDGNTSSFQNGDNASKTFLGVQSNTILNYFLVDDGNSVVDNYFPRTYAILSRTTDSNTLTVQPYLVNRSDGSEVTFIVYDKFTNNTVSNLLVTLKRSFNGAETTVASNTTNGPGIVSFSLLNAVNYDLFVTDANQDNTYFPDSGNNGSFDNSFSTYNIFVTISNIDINTTFHSWNILINPNGDTLTPVVAQYFDANITTDYADSIETIYYDGNTVLSDSITQGQDKNTAIVIDTTLIQSDFVSIKIVIRKDFQQDIYIQTWKIVDNNSSLGQGFLGVTNNLGVFGGLIILLAIIFMALQQFGPNLFGNNESQMFLVGLIMVGGGVLLFPGNLFPILVALTFGVIIYLQLRAS